MGVVGGDGQVQVAFERQATLPQLYTHGRIACRKGGGDEGLPSLVLAPCGSSAVLLALEGAGTASVQARLLDGDDDGRQVTSVALSHGGKTTATVCTRSGHAFLFDLSDPREPQLSRTWRPFDGAPVVVVATEFDPSGSLLALGGAEGSIRVVDVVRGQTTHAFSLGDSEAVASLRLTADTLYVGGDQGTFATFDLVTKRARYSCSRHSTAVTGLLVMKQRDLAVTLGRDNALRVQRASDNALLRNLALSSPIECAATAATSKEVALIAVGDGSGVVTVYDVLKGQKLACMQVLEGEEDNSITDIHLLYKQSRLQWSVLCATGSKNLVCLDFDGGEAGPKRLSVANVIIGDIDEVYDLCTIPSTRQVCLASNSHALRIMDLSTVTEASLWPCTMSLEGHSGIVLSVDAANNLIASSSRDRTARVWQVYGGEGRAHCVAVAEGHTDVVGAVSLSGHVNPATAFLVTAAADRTLKMWPLASLARSKKTKRSREDTVRLSAKWTVLAHDKDINSVAVSPDDRMIASGSQDRTIKIWDPTNGTLLAKCSGHRRGIWSVAFSPVDRVIASASGDRSIRIWSAKTGGCLRTLEGHSAAVLKVGFMSSGTQLVSGDADGVLKAWSIRLGECLQTLDGHADRAWSVSRFEDDKVAMISAGADASVHLWRDVSEERNAEAAARRDEEKLKDHAVDVAMRRKKWKAAFRGALETERPRKLYAVMQRIVDHDGPKRLRRISESIVRSSPELCKRLVLYCREWNVANATYMIANIVLQGVFATYTPMRLVKLFERSQGAEVVEALVAYARRHHGRLDQASITAHFIDYTLQAMRGLDGDVANGGNAMTSDSPQDDDEGSEPTEDEDEDSDNDITNADADLAQTNHVLEVLDDSDAGVEDDEDEEDSDDDTANADADLVLDDNDGSVEEDDDEEDSDDDTSNADTDLVQNNHGPEVLDDSDGGSEEKEDVDDSVEILDESNR